VRAAKRYERRNRDTSGENASGSATLGVDFLPQRLTRYANRLCFRHSSQLGLDPPAPRLALPLAAALREAHRARRAAGITARTCAMAFSNEQHRERYAADATHRAHKLAANRAYHAEHRERLNGERRSRGWRKYGLVAADYERMLAAQGGVCAICKRKGKRWLCVDHCHETQAVRGLLCDKCNTALGFFGDDADRMRAAGEYLDRARAAASGDLTNGRETSRWPFSGR
jgi:hypothetical protein